ncbi:transcription termination factor Rho [Mycobacterium sp. CBMA 234]|uniref:transcription termination factor Rho n=1 Tax=Mycolicibacterium sp. CBMA 234 TaxID=1918495 RepID=UPI001390CC67|nr:transcription termination factor Rho [Mycolicibacterium sp. CBMA 234]MUL66959.1 transcription termination factor Rho [Mycolicibacterium sp. CBMA 234]
MTDTDLFTADGNTDAPATEAPAAGRSGSLTSLLLPDLRALAAEAGVKGTSGMRKSELIAAIREHRGETNGAKAEAKATKAAEPKTEAKNETKAANGTEAKEAQAPAANDAAASDTSAAESAPRRERRGSSRRAGAPVDGEPADAADKPAEKAEKAAEKTEKAGEKADKAQSSDNADAPRETQNRDRNADNQRGNREQGGNRDQGASRDRGDNQGGNRDRNADNRDRNADNQGGNRDRDRGGNQANNNADDDDDSRQGRRGRRFRDRDRRRRGERGDSQGGATDTEVREDDVLQPVAGILDVLDNYAFVRTSGYLAGSNDVYVSMNMVRKNGLRRGDAVTGAVRVPREGENTGGSSSNNPRQKFNPLVRLDSVNGGPVEAARNRPDFTKLTPLYPNQRLRLETTPDRLTTRVIDLIMPIGKGQRALIVSPPKAGKTTIMQDIANAITQNNPECHLMVVLVDERPEEVTDMTRSVKGEVIASTFDRPPSDHTQAAELAIERAKRLVEQGKDVVVLLDSITRLGRAYNNASPASGRILSGGVDSTALYPPKRFLGAARNIENGGSLTIIATAMVETGSTGDTVIFEEFKGTGNAELKLDRKIAERRVFPAVDVNPSGTRKDELLLGPDEFAVVHKLRRVLSGLDPHQAIDLLMSQLRKTKTNYEFLVQVSKTAPGNMDND